MVNLKKLNAAVAASGIPKSVIAKRVGFLRETLYSRLSGETEFKISEAIELSKVLHLSEEEKEEIFFNG